jgi:phosphate uptake regulator
MDLEVLEMVSKALEAIVAHDATKAEHILRDIVSVYDERMDDEAVSAAQAARKVSISVMSHPSFSLTQQANK